MLKTTIFIFILILTISLNAEDPAGTFYAADQSLLIMPTAYTMPKGTSAFTDYELFILQYSYAATDRMHISALTAFPVTTEALRSLTIGIKQNYYRSDKVQSAFWVSFTPDSAFRILTAGNVISIGTNEKSAHAAISFGTNLEDEIRSAIFMLGGTTRMGKSTNFIAEITTSSDALKEDFGGILSLGIRFKGTKTSWDLGGFRPLTGDTGTLLLLPYLKATFIF